MGTDGKLYGTTTTGNNSTDHDTIFRINTDGSGFTLSQKNLDSPTTGRQLLDWVAAGEATASFTGTTFYGGTGDAGTIFKINQDGTGFCGFEELRCGHDRRGHLMPS